MYRGKDVSPHERWSRVPSLEKALAYEALYGIPVRDLFAGLYEKVEGEVKRRARTLCRELEEQVPTP